MRVLTISYPHDLHALAIRWGLRAMGAENDFWYPRDFPSSQKGTIRLSEGQSAAVDINGADTRTGKKYDVVWRRRSHRPFVHPRTHASDRDFADRQNADFVRLAEGLMAASAVAVNPLGAHWLVEHKVAQMEVAQRSGFRIPDTIVSNDPHEIRKFASHHRYNIIYKPLQPGEWQPEDGESARAVFTSSVSADDLHDDLALTVTPGIFQAKILKKYELRVTVMGATAIAVKIDSKHADSNAEDWRIGQLGGKLPPMEPYELPPPLAQKCVDTVQGLGLLFGCLDLIVTPDDEIFFLENNSMGQFLWCEACPETYLLDPFCRFLLEPTHEFSYVKPQRFLIFKEYLASPSHRDFMMSVGKKSHAPLPKMGNHERNP